MKYSHISREKAEQRLRELLDVIKSESSKVNRMKASYLIDNFESWVQTTDCESYWLDLEGSFSRKKHQMRTNEEFRLFKRQKIRDENKENSDDEDNDSWAPPSPTPQLPSQLPSQ
ncbi:unnamed protein product [Rhizophagus irregularis]|nr:unnamed protein product [Rhizophagus irregularis]